MRIISGLWRSQPLRVPKGVRATTDRVREAVFSILDSASGLQILDLYAGSGSLGLEALSRGASGACFVDISRQAITCIEENLKNKTPAGISLIRQDSLHFLRRQEMTFDWIFCDPPYQEVDLEQLLATLGQSEALGSQSLLILETDRYHSLNFPTGLMLEDQRKYGDTLIHFIRRIQPEKVEQP